MDDEKSIVSLTAHYDDGSSITADKGFLCLMNDLDNDNIEFAFSMCNVNGRELKSLIEGMVELGMKIGIWPEFKDEAL